MGQLHSEEFTKGEGTRIVSFVAEDKSVELDEITVTKNMPEAPFGTVWLRNEKSRLIARAISGSGRIAVRTVVQGEVLQERMELGDPAQAAEVAPGQYYAWQNDYNEPLVVSATFAPAFDPELYVERSEEEIMRLDALLVIADTYLGADDVAIVSTLKTSDSVLNFLYGRLLDVGQDPKSILGKFNNSEIKKEV